MITIPRRWYILAFSICITTLFLTPAWSQEPENEDIWSNEEEKSNQVEITKDQVEAILNQLEKNQPRRAEELKRLRQEDAVKFALEIRQIAQRMTQAREEEAVETKRPGTTTRTERTEDMTRTDRWREYLLDRLEEYMAWLEKNFPERAAELNELRKIDAEDFVNKVAVSRRRYEPIMRAQQRSPKLAEALKTDVELQDRRDILLEKIATAKEEERSGLIEELTGVVSNRFDIIIQKKLIKFEELEIKIERMRQSLEAEKRQLQELVNQKPQSTKERVAELLQAVEDAKQEKP
ncbi:MAG: hypothetical protein JXA82_02310 [Sedimentisphaerales bacterium]|nr:hypothetical protein [Sedimentisphaerales bacterium]